LRILVLADENLHRVQRQAERLGDHDINGRARADAEVLRANARFD